MTSLLGAAVLLANPLAAQATRIDICRLPALSPPSPEQVQALFSGANLESDWATPTDSLVEVASAEESAELARALPAVPTDVPRRTFLYRYGKLAARLLIPGTGVDCSLALFGPAPDRAIQVEIERISGD